MVHIYLDSFGQLNGAAVHVIIFALLALLPHRLGCEMHPQYSAGTKEVWVIGAAAVPSPVMPTADKLNIFNQRITMSFNDFVTSTHIQTSELNY